jgi:hypothetical protein
VTPLEAKFLFGALDTYLGTIGGVLQGKEPGPAFGEALLSTLKRSSPPPAAGMSPEQVARMRQRLNQAREKAQQAKAASPPVSASPPGSSGRTAPEKTIEKLVTLANNSAATEDEKRNAALSAVQMMSKHGLKAKP